MFPESKSREKLPMKKEKRDKQTLNIIINILMIFLTLLIVFCAWKLVSISLSYMESRREYNELRQFITPEDEEPDKSLVQVSPDPEGTDGAEASQDAEDNAPEKEVTCSITVDFKSLWEINPDIKGWIYLEEIDISYPIVQGADNDEYLYTSVKGTSNSGGSIFMDAANEGDFSDPHTLIYGHNMKDGSMFGKLKKLYDQDRIDEMDGPLCFWIITPKGKYRYDVFSIHTVDASGDAYTLFSEQGDEVGAYMNKMARFTGVELPQRVYNSKDKVVTLSTCTGNDQYRLIVQGVLHVE